MLKVLSASQIREADAYTIAHEPIASYLLMQRASSELCDALLRTIDVRKEIFLLAGRGNNGGDALVLARYLHLLGSKPKVFLLSNGDFSPDNLKAQKDVPKEVGLYPLLTEKDLPSFEQADYIIDGIFGSGLKDTLSGLELKLVEAMNASSKPIIAIDIPSGLFADKPMPEQAEAIRATRTYSFECPKMAFFIPENDVYVGEWEILPIGLHKDFIENAEVHASLLVKEDVLAFVKKRMKFSHKGSFGRALLIAGSSGKIGAAILSATAAMRSGVGLLTVHLPKGSDMAVHAALPETMISIDVEKHQVSHPPKSSLFDAVAVGPGLGMHKQTSKAVLKAITSATSPMVIDADGLNLIAEQSEWLSFLFPGSIITPHLKEFDRLFGSSKNHWERLEKQKQASAKYGIFVVLKGAHTNISSPQGKMWFNNTGNPGMATAGSGDVLSGILLALLAQGYSSQESALLGVYIHGLAGDLAAAELGQTAMIASDIIGFLPHAWKSLQN